MTLWETVVLLLLTVLCLVAMVDAMATALVVFFRPRRIPRCERGPKATRIPCLTAPTELQESPIEASEGPGEGEVVPTEENRRRPWWQKVFGR